MKRAKKSDSSRARKPSPEMVVLSRENAERYEPTQREICISISDPSAPPARLSPRFVSVLRLWFSDVVETEDPTDILFALDHASSISEFFEAASEVDRIVLHCNMGISRSPGVALGLCDLNGWATAELERKHPGWNRLVRSVMRQYAKSTARRQA
jgi:predicted protein tyrosine phosphatase